MKQLSFAVLGAGSGGQTIAAVLASQGISVKLYDHDTEKIDALKALGKISVSGKLECEGAPEVISAEIADALQDVDVIMICTTTDAHEELAVRCAPYLRDGQAILLNPGHVGGALLVSQILRNRQQCTADIIIAEASDLLYACRTVQPGRVYVSGIKAAVRVAAVPASDTNRLLSILDPVFRNFVAAKNVLESGFECGGAMLHPIPSLMNITLTERQIPYDYYREGISPGVAAVVSACDAERIAVCSALGLKATPLVKNLQAMYGLEQEDLYDLLQNNPAYVGCKSPMELTHRFIVEDLLSGLVPLASIGKTLQVETPVMDAYIAIAGIICGRDFKTEGRTAEKLGLSGKSLTDILRMIS